MVANVFLARLRAENGCCTLIVRPALKMSAYFVIDAAIRFARSGIYARSASASGGHRPFFFDDCDCLHARNSHRKRPSPAWNVFSQSSRLSGHCSRAREGVLMAVCGRGTFSSAALGVNKVGGGTQYFLDVRSVVEGGFHGMDGVRAWAIARGRIKSGCS